jgi:hypothetical protein
MAARHLSTRIGRVRTTLIFKTIGIALMFVMGAAHEWWSRPFIIVRLL